MTLESDNFHAPFMDVSNYGKKLIQAKTMYHGQTWDEDGFNDMPHSVYWTTSFAHALGHAVFGPDLEGKTEAVACEVCVGSGYYFPDDALTLGRNCEFCIRGDVLPESPTDDYIPNGKPMVWALDVSDSELPFIFDGENGAGISYILHKQGPNYPLDWYLVPDSILIATLHEWIAENQIPEIVLEDTSAGYVSNDSISWKRIIDALGMLQT